MTIAGTFLTDEGVVFGADSTTTFFDGGNNVAQVFHNAQKVFAVGDPARFGLCTWGNGRLGGLSHRRAVALLASQVTAQTTVDGLVDILTKVAHDYGADRPDAQVVGYFVGGTDPMDFKPRCFRVIFGGGVGERRELASGEMVFEGMPEFFERVYYGFDLRWLPFVIQGLSERLKGSVPDDEIEAICLDSFKEARSKIPWGLAFTQLPLRDAIDLVHMYLHLTIKAYKVRIGFTPCGGPIEIGFTTADRPFRWVRHKKFDSAIGGEGVL